MSKASNLTGGCLVPCRGLYADVVKNPLTFKSLINITQYEDYRYGATINTSGYMKEILGKKYSLFAIQHKNKAFIF